MDKYKNKYRISSARLLNWNYATNGFYFITICTKNRQHFFGKIVDGEMILNETGNILQNYWLEIPVHFPFIKLGNFVVMPNHMHGILIIDNPPVETRFIASPSAPSQTTIPVKKNITGGFAGNKNPMFHENISRVIRWYKGRCSFEIGKININFDWQSLFHDHIIRNAKSFETIQNYIADNPKNWRDDKFYS